ncbi:hypothetical protein MMC30_002518 [Trapelia coarctata]|nr:hypothetical protein [Trapelia coarctata]
MAQTPPPGGFPAEGDKSPPGERIPTSEQHAGPVSTTQERGRLIPNNSFDSGLPSGHRLERQHTNPTNAIPLEQETAFADTLPSIPQALPGHRPETSPAVDGLSFSGHCPIPVYTTQERGRLVSNDPFDSGLSSGYHLERDLANSANAIPLEQETESANTPSPIRQDLPDHRPENPAPGHSTAEEVDTTPADGLFVLRQYPVPVHTTPESGRLISNDPFDSGLSSGYRLETQYTNLTNVIPLAQEIPSANPLPSLREVLPEFNLGLGALPQLSSNSNRPAQATSALTRAVPQPSLRRALREGPLGFGPSSTLNPTLTIPVLLIPEPASPAGLAYPRQDLQDNRRLGSDLNQTSTSNSAALTHSHPEHIPAVFSPFFQQNFPDGRRLRFGLSEAFSASSNIPSLLTPEPASTVSLLHPQQTFQDGRGFVSGSDPALTSNSAASAHSYLEPAPVVLSPHLRHAFSDDRGLASGSNQVSTSNSAAPAHSYPEHAPAVLLPSLQQSFSDSLRHGFGSKPASTPNSAAPAHSYPEQTPAFLLPSFQQDLPDGRRLGFPSNAASTSTFAVSAPSNPERETVPATPLPYIRPSFPDGRRLGFGSDPTFTANTYVPVQSTSASGHITPQNTYDSGPHMRYLDHAFRPNEGNGASSITNRQPPPICHEDLWEPYLSGAKPFPAAVLRAASRFEDPPAHLQPYLSGEATLAEITFPPALRRYLDPFLRNHERSAAWIATQVSLPNLSGYTPRTTGPSAAERRRRRGGFTEDQRVFIKTHALQGMTKEDIHERFNARFPDSTKALTVIKAEVTKVRNGTGRYPKLQIAPQAAGDGENDEERVGVTETGEADEEAWEDEMDLDVEE